MAAPLLAIAALAAPLIGGAMSLVGGAMSMTGGLLSAGSVALRASMMAGGAVVDAAQAAIPGGDEGGDHEHPEYDTGDATFENVGAQEMAQSQPPALPEPAVAEPSTELMPIVGGGDPLGAQAAPPGTKMGKDGLLRQDKGGPGGGQILGGQMKDGELLPEKERFAGAAKALDAVQGKYDRTGLEPVQQILDHVKFIGATTARIAAGVGALVGFGPPVAIAGAPEIRIAPAPVFTGPPEPVEKKEETKKPSVLEKMFPKIAAMMKARKDAKNLKAQDTDKEKKKGMFAKGFDALKSKMKDTTDGLKKTGGWMLKALALGGGFLLYNKFKGTIDSMLGGVFKGLHNLYKGFEDGSFTMENIWDKFIGWITGIFTRSKEGEGEEGLWDKFTGWLDGIFSKTNPEGELTAWGKFTGWLDAIFSKTNPEGELTAWGKLMAWFDLKLKPVLEDMTIKFMDMMYDFLTEVMWSWVPGSGASTRKENRIAGSNISAAAVNKEEFISKVLENDTNKPFLRDDDDKLVSEKDGASFDTATIERGYNDDNFFQFAYKRLIPSFGIFESVEDAVPMFHAAGTSKTTDKDTLAFNEMINTQLSSMVAASQNTMGRVQFEGWPALHEHLNFAEWEEILKTVTPEQIMTAVPIIDGVKSTNAELKTYLKNPDKASLGDSVVSDSKAGVKIISNLAEMTDLIHSGADMSDPKNMIKYSALEMANMDLGAKYDKDKTASILKRAEVAEGLVDAGPSVGMSGMGSELTGGTGLFDKDLWWFDKSQIDRTKVREHSSADLQELLAKQGGDLKDKDRQLILQVLVDREKASVTQEEELKALNVTFGSVIRNSLPHLVTDIGLGLGADGGPNLLEKIIKQGTLIPTTTADGSEKTAPIAVVSSDNRNQSVTRMDTVNMPVSSKAQEPTALMLAYAKNFQTATGLA